MKRLLFLILLLIIPSSVYSQTCPGNICGKVLALMNGPPVRLSQAGGTDAYLVWDFDPAETAIDATNGNTILVSPNATVAQSFIYRLFATGPGISQPISIIPNVTCFGNSCKSPSIVSLLPITANGGTFTFKVSREKLPQFHESVFSDPVIFIAETIEPPPTPVDCVVSEWQEWSPWASFVPQVIPPMETRHQNRTVLVQPMNGGLPCPFLVSTENRPLSIVPPIKTCNYIPLNGTVVQDKPVGTIIETFKQPIFNRGRTVQFLVWKWIVFIEPWDAQFDHIRITCKG